MPAGLGQLPEAGVLGIPATAALLQPLLQGGQGMLGEGGIGTRQRQS